MQHFLDKLADKILSAHAGELGNICVVFPSRRAGIFFKKYLSEKITSPVWSPEILGIQDFINKLSQYTIEDKVVLIFELFEVYRKYTQDESFDKFYSWGEMILGDFDDIDKNLVQASVIFRIIREHRELEENFELAFGDLEEFIKFWKTFTSAELTGSQNDFIKTWEIFGKVYNDFKKRLQEKNICYEGMAYRKIYEDIRTKKCKLEWSKIIFAGFNALNKAEEGIIKELMKTGTAEIYWDADEYFVNDTKQEAGYFLRNNIRDLEIESNSINWIDSNFTDKSLKNIKIIGAPMQEAQVKSLGSELKYIGKLSPENQEKTAIVLPDESLLLPLLHSMPDEAGSFNITMGYPMKNTLLYSFIGLLKNLQKNKKGNNNNPVFYHKDVTGLLMHPYLRIFGSDISLSLSEQIIKRNIIYVSTKMLSGHDENIFSAIFRSSGNINSTIEYLNSAAGLVSERLNSVNSGNPDFELEYFYSFFTQLNRLSGIISEHSIEMETETFWRLLIEILQSVKIPFEGEPLNGVQIMGMLETRALDFYNVFILSMNEGIMPKSSADNSFIPYHLRKAFRLPTFEDDDAISAYYFYRLISRAKNVFLFYNTEPGKLMTGEKSRFIMQLQSELVKANSNIKIENLILQVPAVFTNVKEITITKDAGVMQKLEAIENFSATKLGAYIACPLKFYFERVVCLKEEEDLEEFFGGATFGNIFHGVMYNLYKDYIGKTIDSNALKLLKKKLNDEFEHLLELAFIEINKEREFQTELGGKNLLYKGIIKKLAEKILEIDGQNVPYKISGLEEEFETEISFSSGSKEHHKKLIGRLDRIDEKNNIQRIIDYKTGSYKPKKLNDYNFQNLFNDPEFKEFFQTYFYSLMYLAKYSDKEVMAGIYSLRNISEGLKFIQDGSMNKSTINNFTEGLKKLLAEIYNPGIPFSQTEDKKRCAYCSYISICHRD